MASNPHQHNQLLTLFAAYAKRLDKLYDDFVTRLIATLPLLEDEVWQKLADNPLFLFDDLPYLKARLQHIFDDYVNKQVLCYKAGITDGVALAFSQDKINLGKYTILQDEAIKAARNAAVASFIANRMSRKEGLSLSDKVWNYSQLGKSEVEMGISNVIKDGLKAGTSAEELGRKVRQYLNNPTMMYRRYWVNVATAGGGKKKVARWYRRHIDEKTGKVTFKDEPLERVGTGVYRSARMNGYRLMRTEINMSYHKANASRWANEPFVYGIRVWKSPEHPKEDICDDLEGYYPKNFVFSGWHPQCWKDGTKVLTAKGWKLIQDVSYSDEICSLNPKTKKIEYVGITNKQAYSKHDTMYRFLGKGVDCQVTKDHRMIYLDKRGKIRYATASKFTQAKGSFILSLFGTNAICEKFKVQRFTYVGMVYDLTLAKNHIMYVQYNGTCFWGSNCLCASAPLTLWGDEKRDFYRRLMKGEDMSNFHSVHEITEKNMNPNWKHYIETQHDAILKAGERGKLAYHLRDNQQYWINQFSKEEQKKMGLLKDDKARIKVIADARHAARTPEQAKDIADRWHEHKRVDALVRQANSLIPELKEYPLVANWKVLQEAANERNAHTLEKMLGDKMILKKLAYEKIITPPELKWSEYVKNFISEGTATWAQNTMSHIVRDARKLSSSKEAVKFLQEQAAKRVESNLMDKELNGYRLMLDRETRRMKDWFDYQRYSRNIDMIKSLVNKNADVIGGAFKRLTVSASDFYLQDLEAMRKLVNETYFQPYFNLRGWSDNAAFVAKSKSPIVHQLYDGILNAYRTQGFTADVEDMVDKLQANIDRLKKEAEKKMPAYMRKTFAATTDIDETMKSINATLADANKWFQHGDCKIFVEKNIHNNGSTYMDGRIYLRQERIDRCKSALAKLGKGKAKDITEDEADAMATFWHEITHNRSIPGNMHTTATQSRYMELANEFVARKTLPEFYAKLGAKEMPHKEFMLVRTSTGYNDMVTNYEYVINTLGLDKDKVIESVTKSLFETPYTEQKEGLIKALVDGGLKTTDGKAVSKKTLNDLIKMVKDQRDDYVISGSDYVKMTKEKIIEGFLKTHGLKVD